MKAGRCPTINSTVHIDVLRCRHSHIYKCCQLLRRSDSVLEVVVFENVGKKLLLRLTNGLESESYTGTSNPKLKVVRLH